jgi:hypothetical protein
VTETTEFAQLAVRAADLADRCEAAGALVVANMLRVLAANVEDLIIRIAPPEVAEWPGRAGTRPR